ncbi:MAG: DNA topoisomerase I [Desulfurococcaceae archaeon]|nr:DNA topoisomerase I [Desulfurococcaceae archaeon]
MYKHSDRVDMELLGSHKTRATKVSIWALTGPVLVIAEKPKAARKIAEALSHKLITRKYGKIPYFEIRSSPLVVYVASTAGHLYTLHTELKGYPVFEYKWVPAHVVEEEKKYTRQYLELLSKLARECKYYVNACDYDIEGSVIGYLVIKFHGDENRAFRAKFSSLVHDELKKSFESLAPLDYDMVESGLCRHELDWIWGINVSRALMSAIYQATGKKVILSAGRVQTPTLKYVADREIERGLFTPLPQYTIKVKLKKAGIDFTAEFTENPVPEADRASRIKSSVLREKHLVVSDYTVERREISPLPPFNLSDLQYEASRILGFSPMKTQKIAEELYLEALISYPRTNSQKLPPSLNYREILHKLSDIYKYGALVSQLLRETKGILRPVEGEKEDPAHPAIYPTGNTPRNLTRDQWALYDLIVRRFIAVFAPKAVISYTRATLVAPLTSYRFTCSGITVEYPGWLAYYPFHAPSSKTIPHLTRGERVEILSVIVRESYTKPPPKLKKVDILKWMESVEVGTEATRAPIIEKLFERKYLENTKSGVKITDLGLGVVEVITGFFPELTSVDLTRAFEKLVNEVKTGVKKREHVIEEAKSVLKRLMEGFNKHISDIGVLLSSRLGIVDNYPKCSVPGCRREIYVNTLCRYHYEAYKKLREAYNEWSRRKNTSYEEYLRKLKEMNSTGALIRDVIEHFELKALREKQ